MATAVVERVVEMLKRADVNNFAQALTVAEMAVAKSGNAATSEACVASMRESWPIALLRRVAPSPARGHGVR